MCILIIECCGSRGIGVGSESIGGERGVLGGGWK